MLDDDNSIQVFKYVELCSGNTYFACIVPFNGGHANVVMRYVCGVGITYWTWLRSMTQGADCLIEEKIVGMAANCERLVAESNMQKKMKNQKAKSKLSEGRRQQSNVRVIQRYLVYIVGLPLNLVDERLLDTCSIYITSSKEDEAIRCIQSVNGFVLEGRPLSLAAILIVYICMRLVLKKIVLQKMKLFQRTLVTLQTTKQPTATIVRRGSADGDDDWEC
ncbi:hypothetical protein K1719_033090 [Acacia pycnantha]|nr:hypothetical protein K1719_033090 [Acacia pycnantha]